MEIFEQLQQEISEREQRVNHALVLIRQAAQLLGADANGEVVHIPPLKGKRARRGYIEAVMSLLNEHGEMRPAEMTRQLQKRDEFKGLRRESIERAIWMEMRKDKPRIKRVEQGVYGLSKGAQRKSA